MNSSADNSISETSTCISDRCMEIQSVIAEIERRRTMGERVPDAEVIAAHPQLMPELTMELGVAKAIKRASMSAEKAGSLPASIAILPTDELERPISDSETLAETPTEEQFHRIAIKGYSGLEEIAHGGQASVFKAIHEATGRSVALKVMACGSLASSRHRARFELEAQILAKIEHPNVVKIIDRGRTADGAFFIAMDFVEGRCLDEYWKEELWGADDGVNRLIQLFIKIADALEQAHELGIIHRDLKPSNIRVDRRGEPHVLDFGLAHLSQPTEGGLTSSLTLTGQILGSLPWASPEQVKRGDEDVDCRSDIYSLGVILFQGLTGRFPYPTSGPINDVIVNILKAAPPRPSRLPSVWTKALNPGIDEVVLKSLSKSPRARYPSAAAFGRELQLYVSGVRNRPKVPRLQRYLFLAMLASLTASVAWPHLSLMLQSVASPSVSQYAQLRLSSLTNSIGIRLLRIPPGAFMMGSPPYEIGRDRNEAPKLVTIDRGFFIGSTPVTREQYNVVMLGGREANPSRDGNLPMDKISWGEANEFCRRLSARESRAYRLPTEAEWEYSCRAGNVTSYGASADPADVAWYDANSGYQLHPVGLKKPNGWGLYDMHGNVGQWCSDYFSSVAIDGADRNKTGDSALYRVVRGGSVYDPADDCRAASRSGLRPDSHSPGIGFRVAMDMP